MKLNKKKFTEHNLEKNWKKKHAKKIFNLFEYINTKPEVSEKKKKRNNINFFYPPYSCVCWLDDFSTFWFAGNYCSQLMWFANLFSLNYNKACTTSFIDHNFGISYNVWNLLLFCFLNNWVVHPKASNVCLLVLSYLSFAQKKNNINNNW